MFVHMPLLDFVIAPVVAECGDAKNISESVQEEVREESNGKNERARAICVLHESSVSVIVSGIWKHTTTE